MTTLIVDDEAPARESLRMGLLREADVRIVGEAIDGPSALKGIRTLKPDLVFLDIQMPGYDGFEVLRRVGGAHLPAVIFVTAYDRYAVKAFQVHAVDYLLKPVVPSRLHLALRSVRKGIEQAEALVQRQENLIKVLYGVKPNQLEGHEGTRPVITRVAVKHGNRHLILQTADIDWITSAGNYLEIHALGDTHLLRATMQALEERLGPRFVRIHRTHLVNIDRVHEFVPTESGDFDVILHDGRHLRMSRLYKQHFVARLSS